MIFHDKMQNEMLTSIHKQVIARSIITRLHADAISARRLAILYKEEPWT
jgi:hypothetical protein